MRTQRWSSKSCEVHRQTRSKVTGTVMIVPGQKTKHEWDCRFCKKECGTKGDFTDHLNRTHWSENKYSRLRPKKTGSHGPDQIYDCKVQNCRIDFKPNYKGLSNHYKSRKHHKVEELLDAGISAWYYRKTNKEDITATANWLARNNYITINERKRELKVLSKK